MTTVRELIQALILNCNLDDKIEVEFMKPTKTDPDAMTFCHERIRRVFHLGEGEALIECHDD